MKRLTIFCAAVLAAFFATEALAWDFLYSTPLGGRWVRSDNPLQVEEYDHRTEGRMSPLVEELGENQWRLYTVWNRTEYTCVDGSVAMPDGYDITVYSPKTNALAIAAHKADKENPHEVTIRQADEAGGVSNGLAAVLGEMGIVADGEGVDFPTERPTWAGEGLATTGEVAEVESTASTALTTAANHAANTSNPHQVTAAQLGALTAETDPAWTGDKPGVLASISNLNATVAALGGGGTGSVSSVAAALVAHEADTDNPHGVTAAQLGALTSEADPKWAAQSNAVLTAIGELQGKTNTFTEAYPAGGKWVVDDPVDFEDDVAFASGLEAGGISAVSLTLGGTTVTNWGQVTGATAESIAGHLADTNNPHGVTLAQLDGDGEVEQYLRDHGLHTTYDPYQQKATLNLVGHELFMGEKFEGTFRLSGGANGGDYRFEAPVEFSDGATLHGDGLATTGDVAAVVARLSAHESANNPHGVTAEQLGALPTVGGTMLDGARIYFGGANDYIYGGSDGIQISTASQITLDAGETVVNGPLTAPDGLNVYSLTLNGTTVTSWTNTPDFAANAAHRAATNNPHGVTIGQLDADGALRSYLSSKYRLWLDPTHGVDVMQGFGHYISLEENCWVNTNASDFLMVSSNQTWDFRTDGPPTYFGTNLATMTDLSVAVADLAPYSWVRSQIASSVAGQYTTLTQFGNHTNDANAHGLAALRSLVAQKVTQSDVANYVDGAIAELGNVATDEDLADYTPLATYTAATNALWGAFAGMATDADLSGLASASDVTALGGRVTVLESAAFGEDGVDFSSLVSGLVDVSGRVDTVETDLASLSGAWPTNPTASQKVVFPKVSYYQNQSDLAVIDPGFYDQSCGVSRGGAISNIALVTAGKVEAGKMLVHGDPVLASTQFSSNYISGNSIISMPRTFATNSATVWAHYSYPDYMGKLHFIWSNATYTAVVTNYNVVTNEGTVTTNETVATVTNHYAPNVALTLTATNAANEEVTYTIVPKLDGEDQVLYIDRTPLYLIKGFYLTANMYPIPSASTAPTLVGFWYEKPATYGEEFDLYGKELLVDEPDEARGVANKAYVDGVVGGVDLRAIYNRDGTTHLNGNEVVFNPRYALTFSNNDMTISYGGFPVMNFKGGMKVVPVMTALTPKGNTVYAYCTGTADATLRLEWCTNTVAMVDGGVEFENVPSERITAQYMVDEYTWCTEIDGTGIKACWMRAWLTSLSHGLTDVELVTEDGSQSFAELFAKVAELHAATNLYAMAADLTAHASAQNNPHHVTAAQIGALTSESDTAALAALVTASNHFESVLADIGENLPGLAEYEARLAELEAWRRSAHDATILTNLVPGANLRWMVLTNLGEYVWRDIAMDENATNVVFAGNNTPIWEETKSGNKLDWKSNANMPITRWRSVAMSANGSKAVALPVEGYPFIRTKAGIGNYVQDTNHDLYWNSAAVSWDGSRVVAVDDFTEWTVATSNGKWSGNTNQVADGYRYLTYDSAFAGSSGDILLSDDHSLAFGALRRFALVMADGSVVDGRIILPDGIDDEATVATRTPYNAPAAAYVRTGQDYWPRSIDGSGEYRYLDGPTNTHVTKLVGGPWVDVVKDETAPHPLYVRTVSQWVETNRWCEGYYAHWTNNYLRMDNVVQTNTSGTLWLYGDPVFGNTVFENVIQTQKVSTNMFRVNEGTWWAQYAYVGPNKQWMTYSNYYVKTATGSPTEFVVTNWAYTVTNRFADTYEPITAAGLRHWADVAVSKDAAMRRMWAVEANGKVWRMTGHSWQDGTWAAQDAEGQPGTNQWKQVVCSGGGEQAIVVGDCMIPIGMTTSDGTPVTANAWYFDGDYWYALAVPVKYPDGHVECLKWKKAFLSKDGYTAYFIPEGVGYVNKLTYQ